MSKLRTQQISRLQFDTSSANIACFICQKPTPKSQISNHPAIQLSRKGGSKTQKQKHLEFQDNAFLQSVICRILTDADCVGINELINSMVFPANPQPNLENNKQLHHDCTEQEQIAQIFSSFEPFNKPYFSDQIGLNNQICRIKSNWPYFLTSWRRGESEDRQETREANKYSNIVAYGGEQINPQVLSYGHPIPSAYELKFNHQRNYFYAGNCPQPRHRVKSSSKIHEYKIFAQKIESDGRTTLMIRHIPNKYSEDMLYEEIAKNNKNKINLLYLPIDQNNSCNVGYAFVNFLHTNYIKQFYQEFNGRRWNRFNSGKICELAYARIQGTTNLMDYFQRGERVQEGRGEAQRRKGGSEADESAIKNINKIIEIRKKEGV